MTAGLSRMRKRVVSLDAVNDSGRSLHDIVGDPGPADPDTDPGFDDEKFIETIRGALSDLPDRDVAMEVVMLRLVEGMPRDEVAELLDMESTPEEVDRLAAAAATRLRAAFDSTNRPDFSVSGQDETAEADSTNPVVPDRRSGEEGATEDGMRRVTTEISPVVGSGPNLRGPNRRTTCEWRSCPGGTAARSRSGQRRWSRIADMTSAMPLFNCAVSCFVSTGRAVGAGPRVIA